MCCLSFAIFTDFSDFPCDITLFITSMCIHTAAPTRIHLQPHAFVFCEFSFDMPLPLLLVMLLPPLSSVAVRHPWRRDPSKQDYQYFGVSAKMHFPRFSLRAHYTRLYYVAHRVSRVIMSAAAESIKYKHLSGALYRRGIPYVRTNTFLLSTSIGFLAFPFSSTWSKFFTHKGDY